MLRRIVLFRRSMALSRGNGPQIARFHASPRVALHQCSSPRRLVARRQILADTARKMPWLDGSLSAYMAPDSVIQDALHMTSLSSIRCHILKLIERPHL